MSDRNLDYGPQRACWSVSFRAESLLEAANKKLAYHRARLAFWQDELDRATEDLRGSIEIRSHAVTGGTQQVPVIDQEKAHHKSRCEGKVQTHQQAITEFEAWVAFFGAAITGSTFQGTQADAAYFGLGEKDQKEDA